VASGKGRRQRRTLNRYTVDELGERSVLTPRTIRSYQTQGLLPPPERHGRVAYYDDSHLERLQEIAGLKEDGLSLASIQDVLARREAEAHVKASRAKARAQTSEPPAQSTAPGPGGSRDATTAASATRTGAFTPETHHVGATPTPLRGVGPDARTATKVGGNGGDSGAPKRRLGLVTSVILGLLLTVAAVSSVIAVMSLGDAKRDRDRLGRQVSELQSDLSRLDGNQGPPASVVVPGPVQEVPVPQTPAPTAPPANRTVVVTTPRPAAPSPTPPPAAPASPPPPRPCTLGLLGGCVVP